MTLVAAAGFYLFRYGLDRPVGATYALFAAVALGGLARIPGTGRQRAALVLRLLPVCWLLVVIGTWLSVRTWSAVVGMLAVGFALAFAAVGGPRLAGAAPGLQLLYILPSFPPYAPGTLAERLVEHDDRARPARRRRGAALPRARPAAVPRAGRPRRTRGRALRHAPRHRAPHPDRHRRRPGPRGRPDAAVPVRAGGGTPGRAGGARPRPRPHRPRRAHPPQPPRRPARRAGRAARPRGDLRPARGGGAGRGGRDLSAHRAVAGDAVHGTGRRTRPRGGGLRGMCPRCRATGPSARSAAPATRPCWRSPTPPSLSARPPIWPCTAGTRRWRPGRAATGTPGAGHPCCGGTGCAITPVAGRCSSRTRSVSPWP
ncbi:hypothetical protein ACQ4WX_07320 [Streptomyces lasalocidi]